MVNVAPWETFGREIEEMFRYDPDVHVVREDGGRTIEVHVGDEEKAYALSKLLPQEKEFGDDKVRVIVYPLTDFSVPGGNLYRAAFDGNRALDYVLTVHGVYSGGITYVVFENRVVQYFNDDLGDVCGQCSTLYQDIAKRIFIPQNGVFYCTGQPHGEGYSYGNGDWP